jgi:hypothetical protein
MMRCKKYKMIVYEGDMLFQGANDHTPIYVTEAGAALVNSGERATY